MIMMDSRNNDGTIDGDTTLVMHELSMMIEYVASEMMKVGNFKDKYDMLDKIREGFHYQDLMVAGMTESEAYLAATGKTLTQEQIDRAIKFRKKMVEQDES